MAVPLEALKVGAVFEFPNGVPRRIVRIHNPVGKKFLVDWEYADSKMRAGRLVGSKWSNAFRAEARCQILDAWRVEDVLLIESLRRVPKYRHPRPVTVNTCCPAKWAFVDQETGDTWGHDGTDFLRMNPKELRDLACLLMKQADKTDEEQLQMGLG